VFSCDDNSFALDYIISQSDKIVGESSSNGEDLYINDVQGEQLNGDMEVEA
jgi:hypothetical protein